ncbi:TPA: RNA 3'-phosphate cyclase [Candidatus Poribacteria bacterium]|nr:RNA 3'-phosphate cyclase [Candidatus Poribacteria bacterium]
MNNETYLEIDGSFGEGGGQILRSGMILSTILQRPIKITNIRAGRKNPGLAAQHLTGVYAMAEITDAEVHGAEVRSQDLTFAPRTLKPGNYVFDVARVQPSAGAISLIFQAIVLPLAFADAPSTVTLRGGTHVAWSPTVHYLQEIFLEHAKKFGVQAEITLNKWGWYPKGGGEAVVKIQPVVRKTDGIPGLKEVRLLERGELIEITGISARSNLPKHIAQRQQQRAMRRLQDITKKVNIELCEAPSIGQGTVIFLKAIFEHTVAGFSALGARGKRAEKVADEACDELREFIATDAAVEPHLSDQLILLMALAQGKSAFTTSKITRHLTTNIWLAEKFLPIRFHVVGQEGKPGEVSIRDEA